MIIQIPSNNFNHLASIIDHLFKKTTQKNKRTFIICSMKKFYLFLIFVVYISSYVFASSFIEDIVKKRTVFYLNSNEKALEEIEKLEQEIESSSINESEKLIAKNILLVERLNFSPVKDNPELKRQFFVELNELSKLNDILLEKTKTPDKWLLVTYADLKIRLLEYLSSKEMYKESMETKKMYQAALKIDSKFSYAYNSYALWLYFAPAIAGGGLDVSYKNFSKAIKNAQNNEELFIYYINRSQILVCMKRMENAIKDLNSAHTLFPEEKFTAYLRTINEKGKIFFD